MDYKNLFNKIKNNANISSKDLVLLNYINENYKYYAQDQYYIGLYYEYKNKHNQAIKHWKNIKLDYDKELYNKAKFKINY